MLFSTASAPFSPSRQGTTHMKRSRKLAVVALALVTAACSVQGDSATPLEPDGPRFGVMYGSGNRVGDDTTATSGSLDQEAAATAGESAFMPGMGYGSGN